MGTSPSSSLSSNNSDADIDYHAFDAAHMLVSVLLVPHYVLPPYPEGALREAVLSQNLEACALFLATSLEPKSSKHPTSEHKIERAIFHV
jgi:hypothetical protein